MWAQTTDQDGGTLHWTPARDNNIDWDEVGRTTKWPDRLVKVDTTTKTFTVRDELYAMGQFAKYLEPGATCASSRARPRTASATSSSRTTRDHFVAILGNSNATAQHRTGGARRQVVRGDGAGELLRHLPLAG